MIHVEFQVPDTLKKDWDDWSQRAVKAREKILAEWQDNRRKLTNDQFNNNIWKDLKEILLNEIFNGKCAYCEGRIIHLAAPDIDHYRPKLGVTESREPVEGHSGYFWLAYEWYNLIPVCKKCNSPHKSRNPYPKTDGDKFIPHPGKSIEFQIKPIFTTWEALIAATCLE